MRRPSLRTVLLGLVALGSGCTQTDVIARELTLGDAATPMGCAARSCSDFDAVALRCDGGASQLVLGDGCVDDDTAPAFHFALCSCSDLVTEHALVVEGPGSIGTNAKLDAHGALDVPGDLVVSGAVSLDATQDQSVGGDVLEDAAPPCRCDDDALLDVAQLVAAHAPASNNENSNLAWDPAMLSGFARDSSDPPLSLDCGRYHLPDVHGSGVLHLRISGHVLLFVGGDLQLDDDLLVELDDGAALDLFVEGNVRVAGKLDLGDESDAPAARLYVGGGGTVDLEGDSRVAGLFYAPRAELVTRGSLRVHGPLFVRRLAAMGDLLVQYTASDATPATCTP